MIDQLIAVFFFCMMRVRACGAQLVVAVNVQQAVGRGFESTDRGSFRVRNCLDFPGQRTCSCLPHNIPIQNGQLAKRSSPQSTTVELRSRLRSSWDIMPAIRRSVCVRRKSAHTRKNKLVSGVLLVRRKLLVGLSSLSSSSAIVSVVYYFGYAGRHTIF